MTDLALVASDGRWVAHDPECPDVQAAREAGVVVATLFDVAKLPQDDKFEYHTCCEGITGG